MKLLQYHFLHLGSYQECAHLFGSMDDRFQISHREGLCSLSAIAAHCKEQGLLSSLVYNFITISNWQI